MSDRIILDSMVFQGTHGVYEEEQQTPQPFEVDVELALNLQPAGLSDDLEQTVDYSRVFDTCRQIVESTRFNLIEALAEAIAQEILAGFPADEVTIRVRKPDGADGRDPPRGRRGDPAPARRLADAAWPTAGQRRTRRPGPPDGASVREAADTRPSLHALEVAGARPEDHVQLDGRPVPQDVEDHRLRGRELRQQRVERVLLVDR